MTQEQDETVSTFTAEGLIEFTAGTIVGGFKVKGTWWDLVEFPDGSVVLIRPAEVRDMLVEPRP
jgi:hypothetical protein